MKYLLAVFLAFYFQSCFSEEGYPEDKLLIKELVNKELVNKELVLVTKIGGIPSFDQYLGYFVESKLPLEVLSERWNNSFIDGVPDQFVVKDAFDDAPLSVGDMFVAVRHGHSGSTTDTGKDYLIFLDAKNKVYSYEQCNVASFYRLNGGNFKGFSGFGKEELVIKLVKEKMLSCFVHEIQ